MENPTDSVAATAERCGCEPHIDRRRLVIDATGCPAHGRLSTSAACRASAIGSLTAEVISMRTRIDAREYVHDDVTFGLLVAAARFAALVEPHDPRVAARARRDPLGAAHEASGRRGRVAELAAVTGLAEGASRVTGYEAAFGSPERELNPLTSAGGSSVVLHDIDGAGELAPAELRARYDDRLRAAIEERGTETVGDESGVETVAVLADGESPALTLEEGAAILATSETEPDAETIVAETRDALLLGMTTAVLDVEAVESGIEGSLDAREIQQKIEGRLPMTLDELATIHGYIESRKP